MQVEVKTKATVVIELDAGELNEMIVQLNFLIGDNRGSGEMVILRDALVKAGF